jgi:hypothetical protein
MSCTVKPRISAACPAVRREGNRRTLKSPGVEFDALEVAIIRPLRQTCSRISSERTFSRRETHSGSLVASLTESSHGGMVQFRQRVVVPFAQGQTIGAGKCFGFLPGEAAELPVTDKTTGAEDGGIELAQRAIGLLRSMLMFAGPRSPGFNE